MSFRESVDEACLELVADWYGARTCFWHGTEWWCQDDDLSSIVVESTDDRILVFVGVLQDLKPEYPNFVCSRSDDALKYLLYHSGVRMRERHGLPRLLLPFSEPLINPGFALGVDDSWVSLEAERGGHERTLLFNFSGRAVEASFYLNGSLEELRSSLKSESGSPLFAEVEQSPADSPRRARP